MFCGRWMVRGKIEKEKKVKSLSHVRLFASPWTVAYQAPPSMGFSRQEYWSELPFPSPGGLPNPEIQFASPALQADAVPSEPPGKPTVRKRKIDKGSSKNSPWKTWVLTQSRPTRCDHMYCSPPGFSVHGIFQARILR